MNLHFVLRSAGKALHQWILACKARSIIFSFNRIYYKNLESDWLSTALISALSVIGLRVVQ